MWQTKPNLGLSITTLISVFSDLVYLFPWVFILYFSISPTLGGSDPGIRAEIIHSLREKVSLICGYACTVHPSAYASVAVRLTILSISHSTLSFRLFIPSISQQLVFNLSAGWEIEMEWPCWQLGGRYKSGKSREQRRQTILLYSVKYWC